MPRRDLFVPLALAAVIVLFFFVLVRILLLRYERGDVFPVSSTLRADPLGTRAFYEALETTGPFQVERGYVSMRRELADKPVTVFYLGLSLNELESFSETEVASLDDYVKAGGRVVITLQPETSEGGSQPKKESLLRPDRSDGKSRTKPAATEPDRNSSPLPQTQQERYEREEFQKEQNAKDDAEKRELPAKYYCSLPALWGFGWGRHRSSETENTGKSKSDETVTDDTPEVMALPTAETGSGARLPWKSALYFVRLEPDWQVRYYAKNRPVFVRRSRGKGEIVVATDSYFVSNEALRNDRRPALLSWVAGGPGRLLFDEAHLGTQKQEGVMGLAEKFRVEGYLYGAIFVAALFVWRNSMPLVPARETAARSTLGGAVSGKDSRSGLVNLLRRNISSSELLKTCLTEWKRSVTPDRRHLQSKMAEMDAVLAHSESGRIVESYQHLREINSPARAKKIYATRS